MSKSDYDNSLIEHQKSFKDNSNWKLQKWSPEEEQETALFKEAFMEIAKKDLDKKNKWYNKELNNVEYNYLHRGTYREFLEDGERVLDEDLNSNNHISEGVKKLWKNQPKTYKAWSCCMNTEENSKGCTLKKEKKFKWWNDNIEEEW